MASRNEFIEYLLELLTPFEDVSSRAMFGGFGLFKDGLMFAIVSGDTLYFKVDELNRFEFDRLGLKPFVHTRGKKPIVMSFNQAPAEALDSSEEMVRWAQLAFEAAQRNRK